MFGSNTRHWRRLAAVLLAAGLFATACGDDGDGGGGGDTSPTTTAAGSTGETGAPATTAAPSTPVAGGEATMQVFSEIATLDPVKATGSGGSDGQRMFALYGALFVYDGNAQDTEFLLAESFEPTSEDFKTWQLKLKPGVTFTDGSPYDAAAVVTNWTRCQDKANGSPARGVCGFMASITAVDASTVEVVMFTPNAHLDKSISRTGLNYIASAKAIADGANLTQVAVGAGPFKQVEWIRDSRLVLEKNPDWKGGTEVYLDKLTMEIQSNEQQRIDSFTTGAIEAFYTSVPGSVNAATSKVDGSYTASIQVSTGQTFIMNTTKAPFDDVRIRRAIIMAINREVLATDILNDSVPAEYFSIPGTPWHSENSKLPEYDPEGAQALIDEYVAEKGGPVKFIMNVFQQTLDQDRGTFIVSQLEQLNNLDVSFEVNDSSTNIGRVLAGEYQWSSWGFPTIEPEPGLYNAARSELPFNYTKYANPEVDALLDEARLSSDNDLRYANYKKVYEQLAIDLPFFPYIVTTNNYVCSPKLQGCTSYEDGILRVDKIWKTA